MGIIQYDEDSKAFIIPAIPKRFAPEKDPLKLKENVLLTTEQALAATALPNLREAQVDWSSREITFHFFFEKNISQDDVKTMECMAAEVISRFPEAVFWNQFLYYCVFRDYSIDRQRNCFYSRKILFEEKSV